MHLGISKPIAALKKPIPIGIKRIVQQSTTPIMNMTSANGNRIKSQIATVNNVPVILNAIPNRSINSTNITNKVIIQSYPSGIIIAAMIYANMPVP
jgi:hypothetical protein